MPGCCTSTKPARWSRAPSRQTTSSATRGATRLAGEITQKIVNYRLTLAVLGDISRHVEASGALRDYVWESNRGDHVWFLADQAELKAKLARRAAR
jgi:hypothetical protein